MIIVLLVNSEGDPLISKKQIHISARLNSILIFISFFCPNQKYLKLLFSSSERQMNNQRIIDKDPFSQRIFENGSLFISCS